MPFVVFGVFDLFEDDYDYLLILNFGLGWWLTPE